MQGSRGNQKRRNWRRRRDKKTGWRWGENCYPSPSCGEKETKTGSRKRGEMGGEFEEEADITGPMASRGPGSSGDRGQRRDCAVVGCGAVAETPGERARQRSSPWRYPEVALYGAWASRYRYRAGCTATRYDSVPAGSDEPLDLRNQQGCLTYPSISCLVSLGQSVAFSAAGLGYPRAGIGASGLGAKHHGVEGCVSCVSRQRNVVVKILAKSTPLGTPLLVQGLVQRRD